MTLTNRFEDALVYATRLHAQQMRKGSDIPYIAHLLSVAALVIEGGGSEDEAIAALLHDAAEDQGGEETLREIRERYGEQVAEIVAGCSDTFETPKPPWRKRKESYLAYLRTAPPGVVRVSLADKLHNARSTREDIRQHGDKAFARFRGGKEGTLWYYQSLMEIFPHITNSPMAHELTRVVQEMVRLAGG